MSEPLSSQRPLDVAVEALREDLLHEDGPQISAMRNYRFAILPYEPTREFELRRRIHQLGAELRAEGWVVIAISLQKLLMQRLQREQTRRGSFVAEMIQREKALYPRQPDRALADLKQKVAQLVEGPDGIAADVCAEIAAHARAHPDKRERMVAFIGRIGALYPFFRTSALLRHVDGRTEGVPVVLLYPGTRDAEDPHALSFMGEVPPTTDYRPRIYP